MVNNLKKRILTVIATSCCLLLITGANAQAGIFDLSGYGANYFEVVETQSDVIGIIYYDTPDGIAWREGVVGSKITYDIYNNTNYTITEFAVGVNSLAGSSADGEISLTGWSGYVEHRNNLFTFWQSDFGLDGYDYAYRAQIAGGIEGPLGVPIADYTGVTNEFSFTFDDGAPASPFIIFAKNSLGEEVTLFGESSHFLGENQLFVPGGPAPVPVPAAIWLLGSGLIGLVGFRRKKQ